MNVNENTKAKTLLIAAGGTGGHVFPALAVAKQLQSEGTTVHWIGTEKGIESKLVPQAGLPISYIDIAGIRGKTWKTTLRAPWQMLRAIHASLQIIRETNADAVLGMGGFASGPAGIAAWIARKPLLIHEQNAISGLTNRLLSPLAKVVMSAFPNTFKHSSKTIETGNPVREEIATVLEPGKRLANRKPPYRILVLGGSQGAKALNHLVPKALNYVSQHVNLEIKHQAGKNEFEATRQTYRLLNLDANVLVFIDDMASAYAFADLIICRAGATTVTEIAAVGVPAIFIPFPHAVDDHQTHNAQYLVNLNAAKLVKEKDLCPAKLAEVIQSILQQPDQLVTMATQARQLAKADATRVVVKRCQETLYV